MKDLRLIEDDCTYKVKGVVLRLVLELIAIYNQPCVVDTAGTIQRIDYTNKIYGLLGQLYQEMSHQDVARLKL